MAHYHYINSQGKQCGPIEEHQLASLGVTEETLVWTKGMSAWQPAGKVIAVEVLNPQVRVTPPVGGGATCEPQPPITGGGGEGNITPKRQIPPENYLVWAILSTLLCCMPLGIVSIVFATNVNKHWLRGDYAAAEKASEQAKTWCFVSAGAGILLYVLIFVLSLLLSVF